MSFIGSENGKVYAPGAFLAHDEFCTRETRQFNQSAATTAANGSKYIPMGTFYPENDSSKVEGIVYEDVDVSTGDMPGSVVTKGTVYLDKLAEEPASGVQSALAAKGFVFITSTPTVTRPDFGGTTGGTTGATGGTTGET